MHAIEPNFAWGLAYRGDGAPPAPVFRTPWPSWHWVLGSAVVPSFEPGDPIGITLPYVCILQDRNGAGPTAFRRRSLRRLFSRRGCLLLTSDSDGDQEMVTRLGIIRTQGPTTIIRRPADPSGWRDEWRAVFRQLQSSATR